MSSPAVVPNVKKNLLTAQALQAEKASNGGLISLLVKLIGGKTISLASGNSFGINEFAKEWSSGGKMAVESDWRDTANVQTGHSAPVLDYDPEYSETGDGDDQYEIEFRSGKHEWIPTNMLGYVIEMAVKHNDAELARKWLGLAEVLRTPTRYVMLKPAGKGVLSGHVGALYLQSQNGKFKQLTKGQAGFHDELRAILKNNLSATRSNPDNYRKELLEFIQKRFWLGESSIWIDDSASCPYFYNSPSGSTSWGATMGVMRKALADAWGTEMQSLENAFTAFLSKPNTSVAFGWSAQQLMLGKQFPGSSKKEDDAMDGSGL
jgi:hypothetical protein